MFFDLNTKHQTLERETFYLTYDPMLGGGGLLLRRLRPARDGRSGFNPTLYNHE